MSAVPNNQVGVAQGQKNLHPVHLGGGVGGGGCCLCVGGRLGGSVAAPS